MCHVFRYKISVTIVTPSLIVLSTLDILGNNFQSRGQGQLPSFTDDTFETRMEK